MYKVMTTTLYCDKIEIDVTKFIKACPTWERFKKSEKKFGKLPPKEVIMIPRETFYIDLLVPCIVTDRLDNGRILNGEIDIESIRAFEEIYV